MTEIINSIGFTNHECAKALEKTLKEFSEIVIQKLKDSFESKNCVTFANNDYVLAFTTNNGAKKYFVFDSTVPVERKDSKSLQEMLSQNSAWLGNWPTKEQVEIISQQYGSNSAFIFSENESGNHTILKRAENGWQEDDFSVDAVPVSVNNLPASDLKEILANLLKNHFAPEFGDESAAEKYNDLTALMNKRPDLFENPHISPETKLNDLPESWNKIINETLLKNLDLNPNFTAEDVKEYLKKSDFKRAEIATYDESFFTDEINGWLWEPEKSNHNIPIPAGNLKIHSRNPREDIKKNSVIAIDFGTSSTVVVEYDSNHPNSPRQICVGKAEEEKYENPTLMEINKLGDFLADYYGKECRPYTKWEDLMVSHAVKDRMGNTSNEEFKAILSHLKQWAANPNLRLGIKPTDEENPVELKPLSELQGNNEEFNPIEVYAYFLGLYLNNRHEGYGIYLNYQLSYPATYPVEVRNYILRSFKKGIRKSIPSAIKDDEIVVEMKISEPEAYAINAMERYCFEPENDDKVKYAIFDFGGGTSDFAFGYWSRADADQKGKDWKIETIDVSGEQYLGGENILDGLAFDVFSDEKNLPVMKENGCKFTYGIEKFDREKGVDNQYLSHSFYARNNMATLIDWNGAHEDDSDFDSNGIFGKGLRAFWENQEKYFEIYFNPQKSVLISKIESLIKYAKTDNTKKDFQNLLDKANRYSNAYDLNKGASEFEFLKNQHRDEFEDLKDIAPAEFKITPTLYYEKDSDCGTAQVEITVSRKKMYNYFNKFIKSGVDSFFSALKSAFAKENDYKGTINIFLAGNASKSPILKNLLKARIQKETAEGISFKLLDRFDSPDFEENLRDVVKSQGWSDEDVEGVIEAQREMNPKFKSTGKTGVAFGIVEMVKGKVQIERKESEYFKFYLGDSRREKGRERFIPFDFNKGKKLSYPNGSWEETFDLTPSASPATKTLYYTTKSECVDGKQGIEIASSASIIVNEAKENEKLFVKAAGVDKIYFMPAISADDAEKKLTSLSSLDSCTLKLG